MKKYTVNFIAQDGVTVVHSINGIEAASEFAATVEACRIAPAHIVNSNCDTAVIDEAYEVLYQEGYAFGAHGGRSADNPYEQGTDEARAWRDGQSDGNDDAAWAA